MPRSKRYTSTSEGRMKICVVLVKTSWLIVRLEVTASTAELCRHDVLWTGKSNWARKREVIRSNPAAFVRRLLLQAIRPLGVHVDER